MPKKYEGEEERPSNKKVPKKKVGGFQAAEAAVEAAARAAGFGAALGQIRAGRRLGEVRKMGQKHKPKKRTFKYKPWT